MVGSRTHIVLVPGFGGFDALGQLEYYAGITKLFDDWRKRRSDEDKRAVFHYFDNLPTAGVATRAEALHKFLIKHLIRNEIQDGDRIVLIGHSTGGLDIRSLLRRLIAKREEKTTLDGAEDWAENRRLLGMVERVVFLSVPHRGTNFADWAKRHGELSRLGVRTLRRGLRLSRRIPGVSSWLSPERLKRSTLPDFVVAALEVVAESSSDGPSSGLRAAEAREAFSQASLWLEHIDADFLAIDDLMSLGSTDDVARALELEARTLREHQIVTRSYATRAADPNPRQGSSKELRSLVGLLRVAVRRDSNSDVFYRSGHYLASAGPFTSPLHQRRATLFGSGEKVEIDDHENDGVVNTNSMLWPDGEETLLVDADHGDIIGHRKRIAKKGASDGRTFLSYDLLKSPTDFTAKRLEEVWTDIFEFCVSSSAIRIARIEPTASRAREASFTP
jgi:hypothetical protein